MQIDDLFLVAIISTEATTNLKDWQNNVCNKNIGSLKNYMIDLMTMDIKTLVDLKKFAKGIPIQLVKIV